MSSRDAYMLSAAVCIRGAGGEGFTSALPMLLVSHIFFDCQVTADLVSRKSRRSKDV